MHRGKGGPCTSPFYTPTSCSSCNVSLKKIRECGKICFPRTESSLKKKICSRGKGYISDAALVAMLFPLGKSPLTLWQWPRWRAASPVCLLLPAFPGTCATAVPGTSLFGGCYVMFELLWRGGGFLCQDPRVTRDREL